MKSQRMCGKIRGIAFRGVFVAVLIALTTPVMRAAQNGISPPLPDNSQVPGRSRQTIQSLPTSPSLPVEPSLSNPLTMKQKSAILQANFKSTKRDIDKLSKLVQALDQEMKKSNPNVLSVSFVKQTDKIAKLARKIKNEAKSY